MYKPLDFVFFLRFFTLRKNSKTDAQNHFFLQNTVVDNLYKEIPLPTYEIHVESSDPLRTLA